eukprot:gene17757-20513_t
MEAILGQLALLCFALTPLTIWMTVARFQQLNRASTVPLRPSSAQNYPAEVASIPANTKSPQYQLVYPEQKSGRARQRVFEDAAITQPQTSHHNQNIYTFQKIEMKAIDSLEKCVKPPSCTTYRGFYGYALDEYSM